MQYLLNKLELIRTASERNTFILADARDADMAWGIPSFGVSSAADAGNAPARSWCTVPMFLDQIRQVVHQGLIDILLASVSSMEVLAHRERLFEGTHITPAVRINDASDIWFLRGARYCDSPSRPFASAWIEEAQFGSLTAPRDQPPVVNLGLYSMTFNNDLEADWRSLTAFREFRADAERRGFRYFLEVFAPNVRDCGLTPSEIPDFVHDSIVRALAGIPSSGRPLFLKIPYFGPGPLEELVAYDPSLVVGVMGGKSGTTHDAFRLLAEARKYGARLALFGRKIKNAEDPLAFIRMLRALADGEIGPEEAVRCYHGELQSAGRKSKLPLEEDMQLTSSELIHA